MEDSHTLTVEERGLVNSTVQGIAEMPAFLVLGCLPFPFLFHKYGPQIRSKCKYSSEAAKMLEMMHRRNVSVIRGEPSVSVKEAEQVV